MRKYTGKQIKNVLTAVRKKGFSYGQASKTFGIPKSATKEHINEIQLKGKKLEEHTQSRGHNHNNNNALNL